MKNFFEDESLTAMIRDSVIIGSSVQGTNSIARRGITWNWDRGEIVKNVKFYNFPSATALDVTSIDGTCGGWVNTVKGLSFNNVKYRHTNRWNWDIILQDTDGSLAGRAGDFIVAPDEFYKVDRRCRSLPYLNNAIASANLSTPVRFAFNNFVPDAWNYFFRRKWVKTKIITNFSVEIEPITKKIELSGVVK